MANLSFSTEIKVLQQELEHTTEQLKELETKQEQFQVQTQALRTSLGELKRILSGKLPSQLKNKRSKMEALDVNEDTGRPSRGARRTQIKGICKSLGRAGETFKTVDVITELKNIEEDVSAGMKSYTYAVLGALEKENFVCKVGRGKWQLA